MWLDLGVWVWDELSREELISLARTQAARIVEQDARIVAQDAQIAELTAANEALAVRLARIEHLLSRNSSNSSSPPSKDDDAGRTPPAAKKRNIPAGIRGKQRGVPGSHMAFSDNPDARRDRFPEGLCGCGAKRLLAMTLGRYVRSLASTATAAMAVLALGPVTSAHASNGEFEYYGSGNYYGYLDDYSGSNGSIHLSGWGCASDEPNRVLRVDVYNQGTYLGSIPADKPRLDADAIAAHCGGSSYHGFDQDISNICASQNGGAIQPDVYLVYAGPDAKFPQGQHLKLYTATLPNFCA